MTIEREYEPWFPRIPDGWRVLPLVAVAAEQRVSNVGLHETNLLSLSHGSIVPKDINTRDGLLPESFEPESTDFAVRG